MQIQTIPVWERPREKLLRKGGSALTETELIAILLRTGTASYPVLTLAANVVRALPARKDQLSPVELQAIPGIDSAKVTTLLAAAELGARWFAPAAVVVPTIDSPEDAVRAVRHIRDRRKEHFLAVYLNARNQILATETVSIGTLNASLVHPREVFEPAIRLLASSVLLAHNHPSGDPSPSDADTAITGRLTEAGKILGVEIMDHIIVTTSRYYSFRESGKL
ncbi:MAG: DNA repair protein RadC [Patescibacteria group bacterium]|nr:DNA repair protein RadC [Patescibacteria group bacterium]